MCVCTFMCALVIYTLLKCYTLLSTYPKYTYMHHTHTHTHTHNTYVPTHTHNAGADKIQIATEVNITMTTITVVTTGKLLIAIQDGKTSFKPITLLMIDGCEQAHHETSLEDLMHVNHSHSPHLYACITVVL